MTRSLNVHLIPDLLSEQCLEGGVAVVIDILRASSTIATALQNGAEAVFPCATPQQAHTVQAISGTEAVLLGGERGGVRIAGFDLGNSPAEYSGSVVRGRTLAFTTTNGTRALLKALAARSILVGCFLNRRSLLRRLAAAGSAVNLVCAGTDGTITGEDVLFAGCLVQGLLDHGGPADQWELNDSAEIARRLWLSVAGDAADVSGAVCQFFRSTLGGRNLLELQYDADLARCAQLDTLTAVPEYDFERGCLAVTG